MASGFLDKRYARGQVELVAVGRQCNAFGPGSVEVVVAPAVCD
jgi:hypothetical protein